MITVKIEPEVSDVVSEGTSNGERCPWSTAAISAPPYG